MGEVLLEFYMLAEMKNQTMYLLVEEVTVQFPRLVIMAEILSMAAAVVARICAAVVHFMGRAAVEAAADALDVALVGEARAHTFRAAAGLSAKQEVKD